LRTLWAQLGDQSIYQGYFANQMGATWPTIHFRCLFCEPHGRNLAKILLSEPLFNPVLRTKWPQLGDQTISQAHFANQMGVTWPSGYFRGLFCEPNGRNLVNAQFLKAVLRTLWA
jgi:hypothetical protein